MQPPIAARWVATERTHPLYVVQTFGSVPVVVGVWIYLWFHVLIPQVGLPIAVTTGVVLAVAVGGIDVYFWGVLRPTAIRASSAGVEIRRRFVPVFLIPSEKVQLSARQPFGFGYVAYSHGQGFFLSPNQFVAAKEWYPLAAPEAARTSSLRA